MLSVKELNEIELIKGQNEVLKKQNAELQEEIKTLKEEHKKWLKIAKEGADANEYCLQELEKDYTKLKDTLQQIKEILEQLLDNNKVLYQRIVHKDIIQILYIINQAEVE